MDYITFKQFMYTINIRDGNGIDVFENRVIRLILNDDEDDYIEIGWYDYFSKDVSWKLLKQALNKKVLDSFVQSFRYDEKLNIIVVWLTNEKGGLDE